MESDLHHNHNHNHNHNILHNPQQQQMNTGLMRYRSAPSSYFANFLESEDCEEFLNHRPSSPETERIITRFFSGAADESSTQNIGGIRQNPQPEINQQNQNQFMAPMKHEEESIQQQQTNYSPSPAASQQMMYQSSNQLPLPNQNSVPGASGSAIAIAMDGGGSSYRAMDRFPQMKMGGGTTSNLIRHSSSPAGLFSNINVENGFVTMRGGMGSFGGGGNGNSNSGGGESSFSPTSRLKNQMNYGSGPPSSSGLMSPISELGNKNMGQSSPESETFGENNRGNTYITGFPIGPWDDSALMTENFSGLKRGRDDDRHTLSALNALENQTGDTGNRAPNTLLSHHLSLPKTSAEMAAMEKLLQFQDSVPCKIRAKRGCATHPRSIAERVRRTRISERMRKLQELVPNMDKQTNTADMLDLAVDYIKDLQKEVKTLADHRSKCTCSSKQKL